MRIDPNVRPQMFHGATISSEELKQLRRVKNIVRKGRVTRLDTDKIYFGDDSISTTPRHHAYRLLSTGGASDGDVRCIQR